MDELADPVDATNSATGATTSAGECTTREPAAGRSPRTGSRAAARSNTTNFTGSVDASRSSPP
ncbi:hypothetical protein [Micromonospora sp. NPDC005305]|uniref:hypothetical protein n=1 Tax=Micromonospora sp. NPDC005305 TaxID=3156875 RepID=UPI0033A13FA0